MTDELVTDRVYRLDLGFVNAYLVDDGDVTLVDAGMGRTLDRLRGELDAAGYAEGDVDRVLVTHYDLDHVGGLAGLEADAPIYAMEPDASLLEGSSKPPLTNHKGVFQRATGLFVGRPGRPVRRLDDGASDGGFTAYHTPGHTPGHAVYVHAELSVALLGDLVSGDDGALTTPPWFICYSASANERSVRDLAARDLDFDVAAMGHGDPIETGGAAALDDLAEVLD